MAEAGNLRQHAGLPYGLPDVLLPRPGSPADWYGDFRAPRARDNFRSNGSDDDFGTENAGNSDNAFVRTPFSPSSKSHHDRVGNPSE